jgi:hypothetical protein
MLEAEDLGALDLASGHIYTIGQCYAPNVSNKSYSDTQSRPRHFLARPRSFVKYNFARFRLPVLVHSDAAIPLNYLSQHLPDCTDGKTAEWWF